ncbi:MAG: BspA family leucine-rich repeat surface protein [Bacteroidales bacterium]|nr:BspA family leucine-rich repeat surface protein [Bacteroidales bacterium]
MKRITTSLSLLSVISLMGLVSCVKQAPVFEEPRALVDIESVTMTAHNFILEDGGTKTAITLGSDGLNFSWSSNDVVGVFPNNGKGTQVKFPISDGEVEGGSSTSNANFTGNGWAVMKAENYSSYYPFVPDMDLDMTAIPVSYIGQVQVGNGTTGHLTGYDYMLTTPTEPSANGNIGFDFKHLGVILQFQMVVPKVAEYTSLSLTCEGKPFISCGTIDITSGGEPSITATEWCDEFEIALENFATTEPNQRVVVNLIMAPDDFSGKQIKVKLKGPHATFVTHFTRAEGKPYKPGTASRPELDNLEGGDVNMIEHGEQFNIAIKSLANGEDFILDKKDYLIKHIVFSAHSSGTPSLQYVDVSDQNSTSPIYAVWDPTASTMYIKSPDAHVFGGETIQYMFKNLVNLESIDFQDFSTEYTKSMMGTFYNCQELTSLNLSSWELSGIVEPYFAFEGCQKLTSITWPSGKTFPKDQDLWCGEMFKGCRSFTSIDLSCFDGCKISGANEMFNGCTNMVNIDMTDIDMSGCAEYDGMFMGCENLATLDLHNFGWSNTGGDRLTSAFNGCSSLESINLGNFNIQNVTRADNVFEGCSALRSLSYTSFSVNAESYRSFFKNCSSLTGIDVSGFVSSKAVDLYEMFDGCSSLESINVSAWNTSNVKDMTRLFAHCLKLSTINLENFKTFEVTTMCEMFGGCKNLKSLS